MEVVAVSATAIRPAPGLPPTAPTCWCWICRCHMRRAGNLAGQGSRGSPCWCSRATTGDHRPGPSRPAPTVISPRAIRPDLLIDAVRRVARAAVVGGWRWPEPLPTARRYRLQSPRSSEIFRLLAAGRTIGADRRGKCPQRQDGGQLPDDDPPEDRSGERAGDVPPRRHPRPARRLSNPGRAGARPQNSAGFRRAWRRRRVALVGVVAALDRSSSREQPKATTAMLIGVGADRQRRGGHHQDRRVLV